MQPDLSRLIDCCCRGEEAAAEEVVRRVGRIALPLAVAVLGSREDAADVAQDVAVDVLGGLHRLRDAERFDAWVRRIAVRHAMRAARARRGRTTEPLLDDLRPSHEVDPATTIAERLALRAALVELPPEQRVVLALRYVHDLSEKQIAETMGVPTGTASSLLARARDRLRRHPTLDLAPRRRGAL